MGILCLLESVRSVTKVLIALKLERIDNVLKPNGNYQTSNDILTFQYLFQT